MDADINRKEQNKVKNFSAFGVKISHVHWQYLSGSGEERTA